MATNYQIQLGKKLGIDLTEYTAREAERFFDEFRKKLIQKKFPNGARVSWRDGKKGTILHPTKSGKELVVKHDEYERPITTDPFSLEVM